MVHHPALQLHKGKIRPSKLLFELVLFCAIFFVFASQLSSLEASFSSLTKAKPVLLGLALGAVCATFLVAAGAYSVLSGFRQRYLSILQVQIASGFANRLLPAGLGGMSLYTFYFRKNGYTLPAATALVATNNFLGIFANLLLLTGVLVVNPKYITRLELPVVSVKSVYIFVGLFIVIATVLYVVRKYKFITYVRDSLIAIRKDLRVNHKTIVAVLCNMGLTSLNVLALSLCASAVSGSLSWQEALLVLSAGTLLGAMVPTPGGIGGVEAGLLAGMAAFGVTAATGFAAVFLYRGLTYWLPILPGYIAFHNLRRIYS